MSSNVGLTTPRGSGTSGYVQRNLSHLKPRLHPYSPNPSSSTSERKPRPIIQPDQSILLHEAKRTIEVRCLELRDKLEDAETPDDEIEDQVSALREKLLKEMEEGGGVGDGKAGGRLKPHQVHELAAAKEVQNKRMERALGIREGYEEGSHWQKQAQRKMDRDLGGQGGARDSGSMRE